MIRYCILTAHPKRTSFAIHNRVFCVLRDRAGSLTKPTGIAGHCPEKRFRRSWVVHMSQIAVFDNTLGAVKPVAFIIHATNVYIVCF